MISNFLTPRHLEVTPTSLSKVLLVGGCIFDLWIDAIGRASPDVQVNHCLYQHAMQPESHSEPWDLRLAQLALRSMIPERMTMNLSYQDIDGHKALFERTVDFLRNHVHAISQGSNNGPTFFLNYFVPQQNPRGRMLPRYELTNPVYFIEELNRKLYEIVSDISNSYVLDIAQISASIGKQKFQDDPFCIISHSSFVSRYDDNFDLNRLEPSTSLMDRYDFPVSVVAETFWLEAVALYRTLSATDRVKMLCIDLDDTMWRGVMAEREDVDPASLEGWPIGLAEALIFLKNRGVILAIVSKNDEARIQEIWPQLFSQTIRMEDFAIRKIGWRPKAEAIAEAMAEANVLADAVVFLDDNPVERAQVKAAHPQVRVIEAPHTDWRRILLWSAEMQVDIVTDESIHRNDMVQAQVRREQIRQQMDHGDFLQSLDVQVMFDLVQSCDHAKFPRALELVNKTNQFNTTGRRWTAGEAEDFFTHNGQWMTFSVSDRYTSYGLVGVVMISFDEIVQFLMSCRVFGLGVEQAVLAYLASGRLLSALVIDTPKNGPCRHLFRDAGWQFDGSKWRSHGNAVSQPAHVSFSP
ncbi:HAD-IIIC family phosphatase [Sphingobium yanoikuyae]|jgi:FkbH-like protein